MKIIFFSIILTILASCSGKYKKISEIEQKRISDSVAFEIKKISDSLALEQQRISDSLALEQKKVEIELSKIAFGDVKFGMNKEEVLKSDIFLKKFPHTQLHNEKELSIYNFSKQIGSYKYDITASLFEDSLYLIKIEARSGIESSPKIVYLVDLITMKYGKPKFTEDLEYSFYDERIKKWYIGDKVIEITFTKIKNSKSGSAIVRIYYFPIYKRHIEYENKVNIEKNNELEKKKKEASLLF
jgi:hypothetical protein